jgi:hypothetical protein
LITKVGRDRVRDRVKQTNKEREKTAEKQKIISIP